MPSAIPDAQHREKQQRLRRTVGRGSANKAGYPVAHAHNDNARYRREMIKHGAQRRAPSP